MATPFSPFAVSPKAPTPDPLLQPLLKLLAAGVSSLDELCAQLATSPEHLQTLMDSPDLARHMQLQLQLAHTALKLKVIALIPKALETLQANLDSAKPEVARRSANTLLHLAGVPTTPPKTRLDSTYHSPLPEITSFNDDDPAEIRIAEGLRLLAEKEQQDNAG